MGCPAQKTDLPPGVSCNHEDASWLRKYFGQIDTRFLTLAAKQATSQDHKVFEEVTTHMEQVTLTVADTDGNIYRSTLFSIVTSAFVQLETLAARFQELSSSHQKVLADRNDTHVRISKLDASVAERNHRLHALETAARQHKASREADKKQRKALEDELDELRTKLAQASSKQNLESTERKELLALRQKVTEQALTIASLEEMATAPAPPASIPPATSAVMAELDHAMQMAADAENAFAAERKALNHALEEVSQKLMESESERETDKNRLEELDGQVAVLQNSKEAVLADLESTKSRMSQAEVRFEESAQKRFKELHEQIKATSLERDQLSKRIRELKTEHGEKLDQAQAAKRNLSTHLAELTEHLNKLREKHEEVLEALSRQKVLVIELEELATAPSSDSEELKTALAAKREAEVKVAKLEQEVGCLREAFEKTKANLEKINFELTSLRTERIANQNTVKQRQNQIVALEEEIRSLQGASKETSEQPKQIQALQDQREHDAERIEALGKELSRVSSELSSAKSELAGLQQSASKVPDPLAETKLVLAKLDSIKVELETRLSSIPPAQDSNQSVGLGHHERERIEKAIDLWSDLLTKATEQNSSVYEKTAEFKAYIVLLERRLRVEELSGHEKTELESEVASCKEDVSALKLYMEQQTLPLQQQAENILKALRKRLNIHDSIDDMHYREYLNLPIPEIPDPPLYGDEDELEVEEEIDDQAASGNPVVDATTEVKSSVQIEDDGAGTLDNDIASQNSHGAYAVEIAEANELSLIELLIISFFEMIPNAAKVTSFTLTCNSANKAGLLSYFGTARSDLQQTWMEGEIEKRKLGDWIMPSGKAGGRAIYRRTKTPITWDIRKLVPENLLDAFIVAYNEYRTKAKDRLKASKDAKADAV